MICRLIPFVCPPVLLQLRELSTGVKALQEEQEMGSGGREKPRTGGVLTGSVRGQRIGGGASPEPERSRRGGRRRRRGRLMQLKFRSTPRGRRW